MGDRGTSLFYSDIACIGSQANRALFRRQVIVGGHIAFGSCINVSCYCRYSAVSGYRIVRARKRYIVLRLYCTIGFHIALGFHIYIVFCSYSSVGSNRTFRACKRNVFFRFYICGGRNFSLRRRNYVSSCGGYRAIDGYTAFFRFQRYIVFSSRSTILFYSDIACIGS